MMFLILLEGFCSGFAICRIVFTCQNAAYNVAITASMLIAMLIQAIVLGVIVVNFRAKLRQIEKVQTE